LYEQNLAGRRLAIVALSAIQLPIIRENLAKIIAAIGRAAPRQLPDRRVRHVQPQEAARAVITPFRPALGNLAYVAVNASTNAYALVIRGSETTFSFATLENWPG
jgi:hypothetical protein